MNLKWIAYELIKNKDLFLALAAVISPIIALIGVFTTVRLSARTVRATLRSTERREWIRDVRDEMAHISGAMVILRGGLDRSESRYIELMNELAVRSARLGLMMNNDDPTHHQLLDVLQEAKNHAHQVRESNKVGTADDPIHIDITKLFDATNLVLKNAWKKAVAFK